MLTVYIRLTAIHNDLVLVRTKNLARPQHGLPSSGHAAGRRKDVIKSVAFIEFRTFDGRVFHVHVPAGAIPKDGPSAGVTMVAALASLLTNRPVKSTVGMTGEVTLQGRVLPIGGLKQKVLAAHAAGLTEVILPQRNEPDLDEVPADVRAQMRFHPVASVDEVLALALEAEPLAMVA